MLEDKYLKSKTKESELNKKLKEAMVAKENNEKEIKLYMNKAKDYHTELSKLQTSSQAKVKAAEDEAKV